jgi:hypothetical protein
MKKLLLLSVAVLAVFSLAFTACDSAVGSTTVTQGYSKIDNPVVTAKTFPGAIMVSWLPVKDAVGYKVIRRDNTTGIVKVGAAQWVAGDASYGGINSYYVLDVTKVSDELVNGRSYTYQVIATNVLGIDAAIVAVGTTNWADETVPILNGKTEVTVSANVPANYTVPAITDIQTVQIVDPADNSDWLKITWKAGDYNPAVKSTVTYSYGTAQDLGAGTAAVGSFKIEVGGAAGVNAGQKGSYTALVPVIGGDNTITISNVFGDGLYYVAPATATATKVHTGSKTNLGTITGFNATVGTTNDDKKVVTLAYTGLNTAGTFDTAAVEKLYRAEIVEKTDVNSSFITGNTVTNWTAVDLVWTTTGAANRTAVDTTVAEGTSYAYTLVLDKADVKSNPSTANAATGTVSTANAPAITGLTVTAYNTLNSSGDTTGRALRITWTGSQGATYRIHRAPNIGTNANPITGTWAEITTADLTASVANDGIVYNDITAGKRIEWYYRVEGTKGTETASSTVIYSTVPWNATGAAYTPAWGITRSSTTKIRFAPTGIAPTPASTEIFPGESLVVYFRPSNVAAQYTDYLSVSYSELTTAGAGTVIALPKTGDLTENITYVYSRFIRTEAGELLPVGVETDL